MTINAGTITSVDTSNVNATKKKSDSSSGDLFASIMNVSIAQKQENDFVKKNEADAGVSGGYQYDKQSVDTKVEANEVSDSKSRESVDDKDSFEDKLVERTTERDVDEDDSSDDIEKIATEIVVDSSMVIVKEAIQNNYDLSDEEFQVLLERVDVSIEQLGDVAVVSDLVAELENITKVDLLIDQSLNDKLQMAVDDIMAQVEMADTGENVEIADEINIGVSDMLEVGSEANVEKQNTDETAVLKNNNHESDNFVINNESSSVSDEVVVTYSGDKEFEQSESDKEQFESIEGNLGEALNHVTGNEAVEEVGFEENISGADIVRQVVEEIKVSNTREVSSIELKLNPENLGKVNITVESKNGVLQAKIVAETEAAEKAIVAGMETLKDAFNSQELKVDAIEVMLAPHSFFEDGQTDSFDGDREENTQAEGGNGSVVGNGISNEESIDEDEMLRETVRSTVSYMV